MTRVPEPELLSFGLSYASADGTYQTFEEKAYTKDEFLESFRAAHPGIEPSLGPWTNYSPYTVHGDYFATGEGQTLMLLYTMAESRVDAMDKARQLFGDWYAQGLEVINGFDVTVHEARFLFPEPVKSIMEKGGYGAFDFHASCHFNFS
jgi:hypothetical protein